VNGLHQLVAQIVSLNGGKVVGKTRLQKMIYLLDQCGLNSGCRYDYHYYGPFSPEIAEAAEDACALQLLSYSESFGFHAVPYGVYETASKVEIPDKIGALSVEAILGKLWNLEKYSAIELELAATIVYLREHGSVEPERDLASLKPRKATDERVSRAKQLLRDLDL